MGGTHCIPRQVGASLYFETDYKLVSRACVMLYSMGPSQAEAMCVVCVARGCRWRMVGVFGVWSRPLINM